MIEKQTFTQHTNRKIIRWIILMSFVSPALLILFFCFIGNPAICP